MDVDGCERWLAVGVRGVEGIDNEDSVVGREVRVWKDGGARNSPIIIRPTGKIDTTIQRKDAKAFFERWDPPAAMVPIGIELDSEADIEEVA